MNKAFTLLELMIVLVIVGVLSTLGTMQYQSAIERSRGAEAKQVLGYIRDRCFAFYMRDGDVSWCREGWCAVGIEVPNTSAGQCRPTHFFSYEIANDGGSGITITATRCVADSNGKFPHAAVANTLTLTSDFVAGQDDWSGNGTYN